MKIKDDSVLTRTRPVACTQTSVRSFAPLAGTLATDIIQQGAFLTRVRAHSNNSGPRMRKELRGGAISHYLATDVR